MPPLIAPVPLLIEPMPPLVEPVPPLIAPVLLESYGPAFSSKREKPPERYSSPRRSISTTLWRSMISAARSASASELACTVISAPPRRTPSA